MDKNIIIKLSLIDIFPSIEEIEKNNNEEISIIFQGLNIFHSLKDLLLNKTVIYINKSFQKNTIIISLVQSINLLATGLLSIKPGKQWVTFSYQNKKKSVQSNFALSLIDCIKINISCDIIYNNIDTYSSNINNNFFNNYNKNNFIKKDTKKNVVQNKYSKNFIQKKIGNKSNIKYIFNNSQDYQLINEYNFNRKESNFNTEDEKKLNLKPKKDININKNISSYSTINGDNKKFDSNFSQSFTTSKFTKNMPSIEHNKMYSTIRKKFNNYNKTNSSLNEQSCNEVGIVPKIEIKEELNILKKNKTINDLKLNIVHKKQKSCNALKIIDNKTNLRYKNNEGETNGFRSNIEINKKIFINNKNTTLKREKSSNNNFNLKNNGPFSIDRNNLYNTSTNSKSYFKKDKLEISTNSYKKELKNNIKNNYITEKKSLKNFYDLNVNNTFFINGDKQLNSYFSDSNLNERNKTVENINNISLEDDNYSRLKEDILLLYSTEYVKNIKEDLLKLEIELFVEKMTELSKEYHNQIYEKLLEYQIEKNKYYKNLYNFIQINKLYNKLKSIKSIYEIKNINKNDNIYLKENNKFYNTNKNEINLYKKLISNNSNNFNSKEIKIKLKKILNIILKKDKIENIINNKDKNSQKIMNYLAVNKTMENPSIIRTRIIPKNQQNKYNHNNHHLTLTNSYVWNVSNDKIDKNKENNIYYKTNFVSPVTKIKNFKP